MDQLTGKPTAKPDQIRFSNDNRATLVSAASATAPGEIIKALGIEQPATVILIIGGADEVDPALNSKIERLLDEGLAVAASDANGLIVDGGTHAGVMALVGKAVALRGRVTPLLGVAPKGKVTYPGAPAEGGIQDGVALDPNHSHFVLVEASEWSDATEVMFKLVAELGKQSRVVTILINGGDETIHEVERAAQLKLPIIAINGSGRLANKVAQRVTFANQGDFEVVDLATEPTALRNLILTHGQSALAQAWSRFDQYDSAAGQNEKRHKRLLASTLMIGILGTLFALAQKQFDGLEKLKEPPLETIFWAGIGIAAVPVLVMILISPFKIFRSPEKPREDRKLVRDSKLFRAWCIAASLTGVLLLLRRIWPTQFLPDAVYVFKGLAVAAPIFVSLLIAASTQFQYRRKWVFLRDAAENITTEIFKYRVGVGEYADQSSRDVSLRENVIAITQRLMKTEANGESFKVVPPTKPDADAANRLTSLTPDLYVQKRLEHQKDYYQKETDKLAGQKTEFQILILGVGAIGALLAAAGAHLWVALTTAVVTALTAWVTQLKLDVNSIKYNRTASDLSDRKYWWDTLGSGRAVRGNHKTLVTETEQILTAERAGWLQQMQDTDKETPEANASNKNESKRADKTEGAKQLRP
jgi:hypothetical protein